MYVHPIAPVLQVDVFYAVDPDTLQKAGCTHREFTRAMVGMAQACVMRTVGAAAWQAGFVVESAPGGYINARRHSAADADVLNVLPDAFVSLAATRTRLLMHCVRAPATTPGSGHQNLAPDE